MDALVEALQEKCRTAVPRAKALQAERKQAILDRVAGHVQESCRGAGSAGVYTWERVAEALQGILEKRGETCIPPEFPGYEAIMCELTVKLKDVDAVTTKAYYDQIIYATIDYVTELRTLFYKTLRGARPVGEDVEVPPPEPPSLPKIEERDQKLMKKRRALIEFWQHSPYHLEPEGETSARPAPARRPAAAARAPG